MSVATGQNTVWTTEITWGVDALDAVGADWDRLFDRCSAATPFQSRIWLSSWCRWYGPTSGRLCVVGVRHQGVLVAAAALVLSRLWLWRVLRPAGFGQSDFCDVLVDDSDERSPGGSGDGVPDAQTAVELLAAAIRSEVGFDLVDFPDLRPGSALARVRDAWGGGKTELPWEMCLSFPGVLMEQHVQAIDAAKTRQRLRKSMRDIAKVGLEVRLIPVAEAEDATARFLELHRRQWADRRVNAEHLSERFSGHLATVLRESVEAGESCGFQALLVEFSMKNKETLEVEHVASDLLIVGRSMVGKYLYGYAPSMRSRVDVFLALTGSAMALTAQRGLPELSLLRGAEPHKYRLHPNAAQSIRIVMSDGAWGAVGLSAIRFRWFAAKAIRRLICR